MGWRQIPLERVLAALVLVSILPLGIFALMLIYQAWQQQIATVGRQNVETARAIAVAIDLEVEGTVAALEVLASLRTAEGPDFTRLRELAGEVLARRPGWQGVLLLDPRGQVMLDSRQGPGPVRVADARWLREVVNTRQPAFSNLLQNPTGEYFFVVAVPVLRGDELRHVLAAEVGSATLSAVLKRQITPEGGVVTLLDRNRRIMARTRAEERYLGGPPAPAFEAAAVRMDEGAWRSVLLEGTEVYAALSRSKLTGWTVGIGLPTEQVDAPLHRSLWALAGLGAMVLALAIAAAFLLGRRILGGLRSAADVATALARGQPVEPAGSRIMELDGLARSLREAAGILRQRLHERDEAYQRERAARARSEQHEAGLAVTLRSIGDAVITTDAAGRVTMMNPLAQDLTGWTEAEAVGRPVTAVLRIGREGTLEPVDSPVMRVLGGEPPADLPGDTVLLPRAGAAIPVQDSAAPVRAPDGTLLGAVVVFRDATALREANRRRAELLEREQAARRQAEALNRTKDDFVATVSHELRNPLSAIFGWVRLLRSGRLNEEGQRHALEVIERNTRLQTQLVNDLLDVSRIIAGNLRLERRVLEPAAVLEAAVEALRPTAEARGLTLEVEADPAAGPVLADADRLQQVICNLLNNSIKFTPKGGRIEARLEASGTDAVFRVTDTGAGIPADFLPHLFERFSQGTAPVSREHGGLGIGLSLVRDLVELHGGTVTAASDGPGKGATFTVRLPAVGAASAAIPT